MPVIDDLVITTNKTVEPGALSSERAGGLGRPNQRGAHDFNTDSSISFSSPNYQVAEECSDRNRDD